MSDTPDNNVKVLFSGDRVTPEQVLRDVLAKVDDLEAVAVVYREKDSGHWSNCISNMPANVLYFMGAVLQRRAMRMLEFTSDDPDPPELDHVD